MITLIQNEKKRFDIAGQSIKGIQFDAFVQKTASGGSAYCDLGAVDVSCVLYQGGKETTIFSGSLKPLAMASTFLTSSWPYANGTASIVLSTGATATSLQPVSIDFGGVINLKEGDKMTVEARVNTGFVGTNQNASTSNLTVSALEGIGLQWVTPKIQYQTIGQGESNFRQNIGDNCTSIHYVNTDTTSDVTSAQPISNLRLFSDRYNVNDSNSQLLSKKYLQFNGAYLVARFNNYQILTQEVDDCRLELDLVPANVSTGQNYIVWRTFETSEKQVTKAKKSRSKHVAKALGKLRTGRRG